MKTALETKILGLAQKSHFSSKKCPIEPHAKSVCEWPIAHSSLLFTWLGGENLKFKIRNFSRFTVRKSQKGRRGETLNTHGAVKSNIELFDF